MIPTNKRFQTETALTGKAEKGNVFEWEALERRSKAAPFYRWPSVSMPHIETHTHRDTCTHKEARAHTQNCNCWTRAVRYSKCYWGKGNFYRWKLLVCHLPF